MSYGLEKYTLPELKDIANKMGLRSRRSKKSMIIDISEAFSEYENYYNDKVSKYTKIRQLGNKGKEGITYLVEDKYKKQYAMKTFRKTKSSNTLKKEYKLQKKASKVGISPCVYEYDTVSKYIVMDKMDGHLLDAMKKQRGSLHKYQQKRILEIFRKLDSIGIFHGDANLANYMLKGKQIYLIDYGFAKIIDDRLVRSLNTETPNSDLMLLGFVLKLKEFNCPPESYKYLLPYISDGDKEKFRL
jgi:tRNA A-37 threonylcarbamoyl transferase component Bud32